MLDSSLDIFVQALRAGGGRVCIWREGGAQHALPESFQPLCEHPDLAGHEAMFLELGQRTGALLGAFLHRTSRGAGAGGVRLWAYDDMGQFLRDGLRLSVGMTRKNALAGLWWGGGKGVIARPATVDRTALYQDYGTFVTSLNGCYVAAEDVGTTPEDMANIFTTTRFVTCIPPALGGSGNPSGATALGVICAMEGALDHLGRGSLAGKSVAVQGLGNVGGRLVELLAERGAARILVDDLDPERLKRYASLSTPSASVLEEDVDILAPCALGAVLNPDTIPRLRADIVCGAANNQLADEARDGLALAERGITYVPDFLANRMGIVHCADEQYGYLSSDPRITRHLGRDWENSIYRMTRRILEDAARTGRPPAEAANLLADELSQEPHPLWGLRVRDIILSLVRDGWASPPALTARAGRDRDRPPSPRKS